MQALTRGFLLLYAEKYRLVNSYSSSPESIAQEAKRWMGYWLKGHEGKRNNCFSNTQPGGQKYRDKRT